MKTSTVVYYTLCLCLFSFFSNASDKSEADDQTSLESWSLASRTLIALNPEPDSTVATNIFDALQKVISKQGRIYHPNRELVDRALDSELIFIDGNRATIEELKKYPISKLKSLKVIRGKETEKYGDSANSGVVLVVTKEENEDTNPSVVGE